MESSIHKPHPDLAVIFRDWLLIGIQSFGGGSSTFSLIHQAAIERGWMTETEFVRAWALVQISPGINLVKLTVLIGYQLAGWPGLVFALAGLLLPSGLLTILMTAGFTTLRAIPWVMSMMKGVLPAAVGLSFAMGVQMAQPVFAAAWREGLRRFAIHILILFSVSLLMGLTTISPIIILLISGVAAIGSFKLFPEQQVAIDKKTE